MGDFRRLQNTILISFCLLLGSCSPFTSQKPSIILILLESFSERDYLCSDSRSLEGLSHLQGECEHFIRFTHAFAPTRLTQPNLASLMSGKEVGEHGVRHNGAIGLSSRYQTLAESALNVNMRTGLFSGGVPLLNKFGISQGVEHYQDGFSFGRSKNFITSGKNISNAISWIDREVQSSSFFMTLYIPDLLYRNLVTYDNLDDERPVARASSLEEVHESLDTLIGELKRRKKWSNTHVIVLGVSGPRASLQPINPLSGRTLHVPLQIKLAKKTNSNLRNLTTELISFAKLGQWVEKMIFHKASQGSLLFSPSLEENFIAQQDYWKSWKGLSPWPALGLRKKQYLFTFNPNMKVYDGFYDKDEVEPMLSEEAQLIAEKFDISKSSQNFFPEQCWKKGNLGLCDKDVSKNETLAALSQIVKWSDQKWRSEAPTKWLESLTGESLVQKNPKVMNWLAWQALQAKNWTQLFELGQASKDKGWMLVSQLNLREETGKTDLDCYRYFVDTEKSIDNFYRHCEDSGLRRVIEGLQLLKNKQKVEDSFWSEVSQIKRMRRARNLNLEMLFVNDIHSDFEFGPSLSELYFYLPEHADYRRLINSDES